MPDASGAPLANAKGWAEPVTGGSGNGAATDAAGAYTIRGLADGAYRVRANADGYVEEFYDNAVRWEAATPVQVQAPQTTPNIDFVLERGGTIAGVVRDGETAEPLAGVDVWADSEGFGAGGTQTDASGAYTITGLAPGDYRVRADPVGYDEAFYNDQPAWPLAGPVLAPVDRGANQRRRCLGYHLSVAGGPWNAVDEAIER